MNGSKLFLDTNICIYLLNGDEILAELLQDQEIAISFITEIELYAYHGNSESSIGVLDEFMKSVSIVNMTDEIKRHTISTRKTFKLKIPDSIIAASAFATSLTLITADKAFKKIEDLDLFMKNRKKDISQELSKERSSFENSTQKQRRLFKSFIGVIKFQEDPVVMQRRWRDE